MTIVSPLSRQIGVRGESEKKRDSGKLETGVRGESEKKRDSGKLETEVRGESEKRTRSESEREDKS